MTDRDGARDNTDKRRLDDLIAECILALEQDGEAAMEKVLAARPDLADRARHRIKSLQASGLLGTADPDPERIGPYRIRQRLGSGGMGTVYLAEQDGDLERRVAIKVIKRGMDSREVLARFALERQALAMLDHQNIAKVLDAGQTEDGRPFLVMEYVSGLPITRYCDERRLSVNDRIALFCLVCEAIQHAHHKGLVHRDLKPSNILVADREGRPWPIVIDFGVAKSLGGALSTHSLVTIRGRVLGTPEYMSPEQAANEMDVDTRTDVFSLGVVLYELLTGTLPIDSTTLRRADVSELSKILLGFDTPAPSRRVTRLSTIDGSAATSRAADLPQLQKRLRGDLDWITLRALERDRNRRYGMPGELAADLQRHLRNEPVLAGPPNAWYRWTKFFARNRVQVGAAGIVAAAVLAGLGVSWAGYRAAAASARQSEIDYQNAVAAIEQLVFFGDQRLADEPQMDEVRRNALEKALSFYESVARGRGDEPRLRLRVAQAAARVGRIRYLLGDFAAAAPILERARNELDGLRANFAVADQIASIDALRGQTVLGYGRPAEAEELLRSAVKEFADAPPSEDPVFQAQALSTSNQLARIVRQRDPVAARREYEAALALAEPLLQPGAVVDPTRIAVALAIAVEHAALLGQMGEPAEARTRAERIRPRLLDEWRRRDETGRRQLVDPAQVLAMLLLSLKEHDHSEELLDLAAAQQRWFWANHPAQIEGPRRLGIVLASLADLHMAAGDAPRARTAVREAVQVLERLVAQTNGGDYRALLGKVVINEARILAHPRQIGADVDAAPIEAAVQRGIELLESQTAEVRAQRETRVPLTLAWALRAANHKAAGRVAEALAAQERAVAETEALAAAEPALKDLRRVLLERRAELAEMLALAARWRRALEVADLVDAEAPAIEAASPMTQASSYTNRMARVRLRAWAGTGDVDRVVAEVRRPPDIEHDWNRAQRLGDALALLATQLPAADPRRKAVLDDARAMLHEAIGWGEGAGPDMVPMVAVMSAQTWEVVVAVERADGDLAAAATAAAAAVEGYTPSFRARPSERNRDRLLRAGGLWLQALLDRGDGDALLAAIERLAETLTADPKALLAIAEWCDRSAVLPAATERATALGADLLRRCLAAGGTDLAAIDASERLTRIRASSAFAPVRESARR
ncbi:MAG: serine/threonine protein kinase [Planctomycetes bacterium]|nr:serine/threonine protein kinase [Planctomycetota bacterium]